VAEGKSDRTHASFDPFTRQAKAEKIIRLLGSFRSLDRARILDIGTGSGHIAHALSRAAGTAGEVLSVDVSDQRIEKKGFHFELVKGVELPFDSDSFDFVISNHVIEHLGEAPYQIRHLVEIRRVLRSEALGYLATPVRWAILEPHYHLPLLGWLPRKGQDWYLSLSGKGSHYDCHLLSRSSLMRMITDVGLSFRDMSIAALRLMTDIEPRGFIRAAHYLPTSLLTAARPLFPTMVFALQKSESIQATKS
jgi:SAM-dependent methyltransferase